MGGNSSNFFSYEIRTVCCLYISIDGLIFTNTMYISAFSCLVYIESPQRSKRRHEVMPLIYYFSTITVPNFQTYTSESTTTPAQLLCARNAIIRARFAIDTLHLGEAVGAPTYPPEIDNPSPQRLREYVLRDLMVLKDMVLPNVEKHMDSFENGYKPAAFYLQVREAFEVMTHWLTEAINGGA